MIIPVIFFGTHQFATTILEGLINNHLFSIELVITQPDRPAGRDQKLQSSPVKQLAEQYRIPIAQPETLKDFSYLPAKGLSPRLWQAGQTTDYGQSQKSEVRSQKSEVNIVAQYGLIIPPNILNAPAFGTVNVHTSLLPKYRGASPIQSALINGETKTGVTIMLMDEGLDTGPILLQKEIAIEQDDTYETLEKKLASLGLHALMEAVPQYVEGKLKSTPQDDSKATTCRKLSRDDGKIDWNKSAQEIYNLYRGLTPWPGVWTNFDAKRLKLLNIKPANKTIKAGQVMVENGKIYVGCGKGAVEILELQLEGKKAMDTRTFVNGFKNIEGTKLT